MDALLPSPHSAVSKRGVGFIHALLDGVSRANAVNMEVTDHQGILAEDIGIEHFVDRMIQS